MEPATEQAYNRLLRNILDTNQVNASNQYIYIKKKNKKKNIYIYSIYTVYIYIYIYILVVGRYRR